MSETDQVLPPETENDDVFAALNPRQRAFVHEYVVDLNATAAAIRAGYKPSNAQVTGSYLLSHSMVSAAIEVAKAQRLARVNITADSVLSEMALLANSRIDHYYVDDEGQVQLAPGAPSGAMAAIQSIQRKTHVKYDKEGNEIGRTYDVMVKLWDKPTPLKLMGRHAGVKAFFDRVEVTGKDGGPIEHVGRIERVIIDPKSDESDSSN